MVGVAQKTRPPKQKPSTAAPGITIKPRVAATTTTTTTTTATHPVVVHPPSTTARASTSTAVLPTTSTKTTTATTTPATTSTTNQVQLQNDLALMTKTQSTLIVKTMLEAAFGCITYLRGLLPEDNFEDDYVGAPSVSSLSSESQSQGPAVSSQAGIKGVKTKRLVRGCSPEADKILNWMDGMMHAIERSYLKTCIFGVYLDPDEPENLVEALTISFHYPLIPGTSIPAPHMTISDGLSTLGQMDLENESQAVGAPSSQLQGMTSAPGLRLKTIGEVKRMIRVLLRSLNLTCTGLEEIPARRFGTMKLVYNETAPEDYEPPHFVPLAGGNKNWYFGTKDEAIPPLRSAFGYVETGFHSMSVKMTSIVSQLPIPPDAMEEESMPFGTATESAGSLIAGEKRRRELEDEMQRQDAAKRRVIWSAEKDADERGDIDPSYRDAEGEPDEEISASQRPSTEYQPEGILRSDGTLRPLKNKPRSSKKSTKTTSKRAESLPKTAAEPCTGPVPSSQRLAFPRPEKTPVKSGCTTETDQALSPTYVSKGNNAENLSPYDLAAMQAVLAGGDTGDNGSQFVVEVEAMQVDDTEVSTPREMQPETMDMLVEDPVVTQMSSGMDLVKELQESIQVESLETNKEKTDDADSIASFSQDDRAVATVKTRQTTTSITETLTPKRSTRNNHATKKAEQPTKPSQKVDHRSKRPRACACGDANADLTMVGCENCARWFHLPCAGYLEPKNLPQTYYCIECLLRLTGNDTDARIEHVGFFLPGIALMRRALWIGYTEGEIKGEVAFAKRLGCGLQDIKTLIKRIINEGFLVPILSDSDRVKVDPNPKSHKKKSPTQKSIPAGFDPLKSPKGWQFVNDITRSNKLRIWFAPGGRIEKEQFGIDRKIVAAFKNWSGGPQYQFKQPGKEPNSQSQTTGLDSIKEDETQDESLPAAGQETLINRFTPQQESMHVDPAPSKTDNSSKDPPQHPASSDDSPNGLTPQSKPLQPEQESQNKKKTFNTPGKNRRRRLFPTPSPPATSAPIESVIQETEREQEEREGEEEEIQEFTPNDLDEGTQAQSQTRNHGQDRFKGESQPQPQSTSKPTTSLPPQPQAQPPTTTDPLARRIKPTSHRTEKNVSPQQEQSTVPGVGAGKITRSSERISRAKSVIDLCATF